MHIPREGHIPSALEIAGRSTGKKPNVRRFDTRETVTGRLPAGIGRPVAVLITGNGSPGLIQIVMNRDGRVYLGGLASVGSAKRYAPVCAHASWGLRPLCRGGVPRRLGPRVGGRGKRATLPLY